MVPKDVPLDISGLRDREAEVPCAPSDPVPSRAPGLCRIHVAHPGCREGAQGSRALPALHGTPPVLGPEARWGPSPGGGPAHTGRSARGLRTESLPATHGGQ